MTFDVCMIILTAFAIFGGYCLAEMVSDAVDGIHSPPSVTVMPYSEDDSTYKKVRRIYNNVPHNTVVFVGQEDSSIYPDSISCSVCEISAVVTNVLFTKNN